MPRYIDADAFLASIPKLVFTAKTDVAEGMRTIVEDINDFPTADVQEVKHAKWIRENVECKPRYEWRKCSFCHGAIKRDKNTRIDFPWFCEYCGARMDGGEDK